MSICFTWFPIGDYRRTQYIPRFGGVLQETGKIVERECVNYKYLHLTGLWLGVMDRDNATDRNVYSIPHPSSL